MHKPDLAPVCLPAPERQCKHILTYGSLNTDEPKADELFVPCAAEANRRPLPEFSMRRIGKRRKCDDLAVLTGKYIRALFRAWLW